MTKPIENPFFRQLQQSPYVRFIENGHSFVMLTQVMRSTKGLEEMISKLFYENQLNPGIGTELENENRIMSRVWQEKIGSLYPSLKPSPAGLVYPVFITIYILGSRIPRSYQSYKQLQRLTGSRPHPLGSRVSNSHDLKHRYRNSLCWSGPHLSRNFDQA